MDSLKESVARQRKILSSKLSWNQSTLSQELIEACISDIWIILSDSQIQRIRRFSILARLLDNLLDDEEVDHKLLEFEIKSPNLIFELKDFSDWLDPQVRWEFIRQWVLAMRIMWMYESNPSVRRRLLESRILAKLYTILSLPIHWDPRWLLLEEHFFNLFAASYMFCDLKDFSRDGRELRDIPIIVMEMFHKWLSYLYKACNPRVMWRIILETSKKSLLAMKNRP